MHDFTYKSCKNLGLLLYECMRAQNSQEQSQCLRAHKDKKAMCKQEGGKRLCKKEAQKYDGCASRGVRSCISRRKLKLK